MQTQLPFFAVVKVSGEDRHDFLHKQFSNDINNLAKNHACYATYNTPKGRVIVNLLAYNTGDEILLAMAADLAEKVVKRLRMFVLRAKVQLEILADWGVSGSLKDGAQPVLPTEPHLQFAANEAGEIELPHSGSLKIAPKAELPEFSAEAEVAWNTHEILSGYPWVCAATSEACVAQMLNQHTIGGVHFRKGCYPGQEIIARAQYRGQVKRGLAVAKNEHAQTAGAEVLDASGAEAGVVMNVSGSLNLLVVKHGAVSGELRDTSGNVFALAHLFFENNQSEE
ncbi:folate-binding protein [Kingella negevensis]|uniref:CAF17-like 4Fe-4S cluster assembly/insertion protein YgfZ n=1 Tax=Kingella negevensis TaxID=1522312 RepID=UPI00254B31C4|nr:folate-binding protein [Kingella negevensis]MDK4706975.1 folate-binding protein [Kingella negevensis]MDK4710555.1 folate-binding protein [Kingella negevensis]